MTGVEVAHEWFCRIVSISCIIFGLLYWVRLIGVYDGNLWRFDLMPLHWQVAAVMLSVLFPIAAIGLWMTVSWGPVIWLIAATVEVAMHQGLPEYFGVRPALVALHVATAIAFAGFRIVLFMQHRQRAESH